MSTLFQATIRFNRMNQKSTLPLIASDGSRRGTIDRHVDIYAVNPAFEWALFATALIIAGAIGWQAVRMVKATKQK